MEDTHPSTAVTVRQPGAITTIRTAQALLAKIEEQKAFRRALIGYVESEMDQDRHFYQFPGQEKKALSQDGSRNLWSLYEVSPGPPDLDEKWFDDGHYQCRATVHLFSMATGTEVAVGTGSCSTRESKYAYRWVFPGEVPSSLNKADLQSRQTRKGQTMYRIPNPDLADQYNTVLKMAEKRAGTAATLRLPCVSEIFAEGDEEQEETKQQEQETRERALTTLRQWIAKIPKGARDNVARLVCGREIAQIANAPQDVLDSSLRLIEKANTAGIDWTSKTLEADLKAMVQGKAAEATATLFSDEPTPAEQREATRLANAIQTTLREKGYEIDPQIKPALEEHEASVLTAIPLAALRTFLAQIQGYPPAGTSQDENPNAPLPLEGDALTTALADERKALFDDQSDHGQHHFAAVSEWLVMAQQGPLSGEELEHANAALLASQEYRAAQVG